MLALSRDLDVQYKTAFVIAHKIREAVASSTKEMVIGGRGKIAEIDGAYFGGHIRPKNLATNRVDCRLLENQPGNRKVVLTMRERGGRTLAQVFRSESAAIATIRERVAKGTIVHADDSLLGTRCMRTLRCDESITRTATALTALAPMGLSPTSSGLVEVSSDIITISLGLILRGTHRKLRGVKICSVLAMATYTNGPKR